ncbi:hypothetical protein E4U21_005809 [Claviceps maximensis]|nr:hypothetical protein E4U21_005809 [Claviceps maximensis]
MSTVCNFECAVLLARWLVTLSETTPNDARPSTEERGLLQSVTSMLDETEFGVPGDAYSVGGSRRVSGSTPGSTPRSTDCEVGYGADKLRQLAGAVLRLWAETFKGVHVFEMVNIMGASLDAYADLVETRRGDTPGSSNMPIVTELTKALGIRVPVVQGGMMHVGTADLASAVSNAGGLGIITALIFTTPDALREEIRRCRTLTKSPFGVNITRLPSLVPPDYGAYAQAVIDEGIRIVETAGNSPAPIIKQLKSAGVIVLHKCTTIRHAQSAVKLGVDFLSIDGFECAGHVGESDITNFILLSKARQTLSVPFIASGGFADGHGLAAALLLGASGVNMGTRFMATVEAPVHRNIKDAIVEGDEHDTTLLLRRWRNTTRLYKNKVAVEALEIERGSPSGEFSEIAHLVSGKRGKEVFVNGDPDYGVWTAGLVMGLINDVPTCEVLVRRIEKEAEEAIRQTSKVVVPQSKL